MIVGIENLINRRRDGRRSHKKIDTIDNQSSLSIEEAKAKVQAIIDSGKASRKKKNRQA